MSSSPQPVSSISTVVTPDDLNAWAGIAGVLRYLTEPINPAPPPAATVPLATDTAAAVYANTYAAGIAAGMEHTPSVKHASAWAIASMEIGQLAAWIAQLAALILSPLVTAMLAFIGGVRKGIDPAIGAIATDVLNEFLGTEFTAQKMPLGIGTGDHLTRAKDVGGLLIRQLATEFAPADGVNVVPSMQPAATFSGLAINFGLATAVMAFIGGLVPYGYWDELRQLGEEVANNIGLGRLVRRALTPLVQILVSQPMTWAINQQYLPTQFTLAELVNPYAQTALDSGQIFKAMNLLGYSNDKIQAVIEMHQKRLTPPDVKLLLDNSAWDEQASETYVAKLNWPAELVPTVMLLEELRAERPWHDKLVAELETEVKNHVLTLQEFETVIRGLPYSKQVQDLIVGTATYKYNAKVGKTKVAHLSYGQLKQAFENGLVTLTEVEDRWTAQGYTPEDIDVLGLLLLLDMQKFTAAQAAAAAKAAKKSTAATTSSKTPASGLVTGTPPAAPTA